MSISEIVGIATTGVLGLGWLFRLESRISVSDQRNADLKEYLKDLLEVKFDNVDSRLSRIERALNGSLVKD